MFVITKWLFAFASMFLLTFASMEERFYDQEFRDNFRRQSDENKARELLIRQLLLKRYERWLSELKNQNQPPPQVDQPLFTYSFPPEENNGTFAVPPSDQRFYTNNQFPAKNQDKFSRTIKQNSEEQNLKDTPVDSPVDKSVDNSVADADVGDTSNKNVVSSNNVNVYHQTNQEPKSLLLNSQQEQPISYPNVIDTPIGRIAIRTQDIFFLGIATGCVAAIIFIIIAISCRWYRMRKKAKMAADVEYPAYGITGPNKEISPTGDRKLAESAQMYHYQHQKQQIISMSNRATNDHRGSGSEAESDEENEEGDYTVYECPGLAATGEMEVKNPLFLDDPTPAAKISQPTITPSSPEVEDKNKK